MFYFSTTRGEKSAKFAIFQWNNYIFTKPNCKKLLILKNQLKRKIFRMSCKELKSFLVFKELITKIQYEFKQILHISKYQPWKKCEFYPFSTKQSYIYAARRKKLLNSKYQLQENSIFLQLVAGGKKRVLPIIS